MLAILPALFKSSVLSFVSWYITFTFLFNNSSYILVDIFLFKSYSCIYAPLLSLCILISVGISLKDLSEFFLKYKAYNAANLDGGQSTQLVIDNNLINAPNHIAKKQGGRYVVTGWGLIP